MDGTLIDSTNAVVRHWQRFVNHAYSSASNVNEILTTVHRIGNEYGIDPNAILATSHGRRSIDVFQQIDPARATWDCVSSRPSFHQGFTLTHVSRRPRARETGTAPVRGPGGRDSRRAAIPNEPGELKCQMGNRHIRHEAASRRVAEGSSPCRAKTTGHRGGCGKGKAGSGMLSNGPREAGRRTINALSGLGRCSRGHSCRQGGWLQGPGARYDA